MVEENKEEKKLCLTWDEVCKIVSWIGYKNEEEEPLWGKIRDFFWKYDPNTIKQQEFIKNRLKKNKI